MTAAGTFALVGPLVAVLFAAVGFMLRRLIANSDAANQLRHDALLEACVRIERNLGGLAKRHDEALTALNDLMREGFELAAKERAEMSADMAYVRGSLGMPSRLNGG